jgi:hypothetical protein
MTTENSTQAPADLNALLSTKAVAIVNIAPEHDAGVKALYTESLSLLTHAEALTIVTAEDNNKATGDVAIVSKLKKAIEGLRKEYVSPIREHLDAINNTFKDFTAPLDKADIIIRGKIKTYNLEQERKQKEQEEINRLRLEAAQKEAALYDGEISESVNLVEVVAPQKSVTDLGSTGMRDNWTYEVTDFAQVPDEYKMLNTSAVNSFVKSNKGTRPIPGIRIFNDRTVVVRAK